jgi:hypothetical protein
MIPNTNFPRASTKRFEELSIRKVIYNVDSRFRRLTSIPSTNYQYQFETPVNHVISIRVSSVELPNSYPMISETMNTNYFHIRYNGDTFKITIPSGNYTSAQLLDELNKSLSASGKGDWEVTINEITGKFTITETNGTPFCLYHDKDNHYPKRTRDFGLGSILGFREKTYINESTYTSESSVNLYGDSYLLVKINDYDLMNTRSREKEVYTAIAKVILDNPKNNYVFDNNTFITKRYVFTQPVDIRVLNIQLLNPNGDIVDLADQDWSMSLEMEIVEDSLLYEQYRNRRLV